MAGEAPLPPSKRRHALAATYADAALECPSYRASSVAQPNTSSCLSSQSSPCVATAFEGGNGSRQHIQESVSNDVSLVRFTISPVHLNQKSLMKTIVVEEMDICQHSIEKPESLMQVEKATSVSDEDVKNVCTSIFVGDSLMETRSTRPLSSMDGASEPALRLKSSFAGSFLC